MSIEQCLQHIAVLGVKSYQLCSHPMYQLLERANISAFRCRYTPSCSEYMIESIRIHGLFKGIHQGSLRIARCNPAGGFGYDPVQKPICVSLWRNPRRERKNELKQFYEH